MTIDLNCDMGESWYDQLVGQDEAILPYISSCNLACGFHGGDALSLQKVIAWALEAGVVIGAHPSFPDRKNFGRLPMDLPPDTLAAILQYQVAALQGMVAQQGSRIQHLKPHGALYHLAASDSRTANILAKVALGFDIPVLIGPPASELEEAAIQNDLQFAPEGFVDRVYMPDLRLRSRKLEGAMIKDPEIAAEQALGLARDGQVVDFSGQLQKIEVRTLCVHGDQPQALSQLRAIRAAFAAAEIEVAPIVIDRLAK